MAKTKKAAGRTASRKTVSRPAARKAAKAPKAAARKGPARKAAAASPERYEPKALTPYLNVGDAAGAIAWYRKAFGAKELMRMPDPSGKLMHAHLRIGGSDLFLSDIYPGTPVKDPKQAGPSVTIHLYHRGVDKLWRQAVENGASVVMPLDDQFWGDRYGQVLDPFGHLWSLSYKSKLGRKALDAKREQAMKELAALTGAAPP